MVQGVGMSAEAARYPDRTRREKNPQLAVPDLPLATAGRPVRARHVTWS